MTDYSQLYLCSYNGHYNGFYRLVYTISFVRAAFIVISTACYFMCRLCYFWWWVYIIYVYWPRYLWFLIVYDLILFLLRGVTQLVFILRLYSFITHIKLLEYCYVFHSIISAVFHFIKILLLTIQHTSVICFMCKYCVVV
jgi:hypothetical protein